MAEPFSSTEGPILTSDTRQVRRCNRRDNRTWLGKPGLASDVDGYIASIHSSYEEASQNASLPGRTSIPSAGASTRTASSSRLRVIQPACASGPASHVHKV